MNEEIMKRPGPGPLSLRLMLKLRTFFGSKKNAVGTLNGPGDQEKGSLDSQAKLDGMDFFGGGKKQLYPKDPITFSDGDWGV